MKLILPFLLVLIIISCGDKIIKTKYDTGEKHEEYNYTGDSLKNGIYKQFSKSGILREKSNYENGKLNGERRIFNKNGNLEIIELYENEILNGPYQEFYDNGTPKMIAKYTNNILEGLVKVYFSSGKIKEEVYFANNLENGPFKEFYENGKLKWEGAYKNGNNEFGLIKRYNEQGVLIRKLMCDDQSICTTTWTIDGSHLK
ncbi:MAG: toxin-antitoxin system YwqK family antitoxin [Saprospiraceae bacterium]